MLLESFRSTFERWQASSIWHFLSKKGHIHYSGPHNFFITLAILCEGLWILLDHDSNVLQEKKLTRRQRCRLKPPQMWILSRFVFCQVGYKAKEVWQVSNWPRRLGEFWVALPDNLSLCRTRRQELILSLVLPHAKSTKQVMSKLLSPW